jgi:hypothetical protein
MQGVCEQRIRAVTPLEVAGLALRPTNASFETSNRKVLTFGNDRRPDEEPVMVFRQRVHRMWMTWKQDPHREPHGWAQRTAGHNQSWESFTPNAWIQLSATVQRWFLLNDGYDAVFDEVFRISQRVKTETSIDYDALKARYRYLGDYVADCARLAEGLGAGFYQIRQTPDVTREFHTPRFHLPDRPHHCEPVSAAVWDGATQIGWIVERDIPVPMIDYTDRA